MDDGEDWMMRPIMRQLIPYKAMDDVAYDLSDFVFLCELLDVEAENTSRIRAYEATKVKRAMR